MIEPKTRSRLDLIFATSGRKCKAMVDGEMMPGVRAITLEARPGEVTSVTIDAFWPWPATISPDTHQAMTRTFSGFFVSEEDWPRFLEWLEQRMKP